ncbi:MAG: hypothetical protein A3D97_02015 [Nitrospinae bacterium RIFCSPHIGHO2_12_FULL_39_42]|nr:MAG: hypothetical protein A3D97_02015 [Nitrospinae bacterium RIFCSPHIGHO2_12_FULL_39_42]
MISDSLKSQPPLKELISQLILTTHAPGRHAARNAFAHIENAWKIKDIDPAMSAFRSITGVEEAATAIFHALKRQKYNNAQSLNKNRHFHKAAVYPFFQAISRVLSSFNIKAQIICDTNEQSPKLKIAFSLPFEPFKDRLFYPEPPLHFELTMNNEIHNFSDQIEQIVSENNAKSFCKYSNELANFRNKILYASNQGIPTVKITENNLKKKEQIIVTFLIVYLLISQYDEQQLFVQQALDSFVKTLNLSDKICI